MKAVFESSTVIVTYFGGRLLHTHKFTAGQMRSRRQWTDFDSAKRAYDRGELLAGHDWEPLPRPAR
jgi:hypothetical protein